MGLGLLTLVCSSMLGSPLELSWWVLGMSMLFFVVFVVVKMAKKTTSGSCLNVREVVVVAARHGFTVSLCPGSEVRKSMRMEGKTDENDAPFAS